MFAVFAGRFEEQTFHNALVPRNIFNTLYYKAFVAVLGHRSSVRLHALLYFTLHCLVLYMYNCMLCWITFSIACSITKPVVFYGVCLSVLHFCTITLHGIFYGMTNLTMHYINAKLHICCITGRLQGL